MVTAGSSADATAWNGDLIFGGSGDDLIYRRQLFR